MKQTLYTTPLTIVVSLIMLVSVLLHDTRLAKLATTMIGIPAVIASTDAAHRGLSPDPHTHVERINVGELRGQLPRLMPRATEDKKYVLHRPVRGSSNPFEGNYLPLA